MSTGLQEHDIVSMLGVVFILSDHMRQQETAFLFYRVCSQQRTRYMAMALATFQMPLGVQSSAKCVNLYPMLDLRHAVQAVL